MKCILCGSKEVITCKDKLGNKIYLCKECIEKLRKLGKIIN